MVNPFTHPDGTLEWRHSRVWLTHDHDPEPVPVSTVVAELICDFCGENEPRWTYYGVDMRSIVGDTVNDYGGKWAGCDTCDQYVRRRDLDGLLDRIMTQSQTLYRIAGRTEGGLTPQEKVEMRRMLGAQTGTYLESIYKRELMPPPAPPMPELVPSRLPRVRDRLVTQWREVQPTVISRTADRFPGTIALPTEFTGGAGIGRPVHAVSPDVAQSFCDRVADGLTDAVLYWVSTEFSTLAVSAGAKLPDLSITLDELPTTKDGRQVTDGLIYWQEPILQTDVAGELKADVVAASWTITRDGLWVVLYARAEVALAGSSNDPQHIREITGWLVPVSSGGGMTFGRHENNADSRVFATLLSTWFLMAQPGVAGVAEQQPDKALRRSYGRANRPSPVVQVVDLRRTKRAAQADAGGDSQRTYSCRWMVEGFWRDQAHGPGWSLRKRIYISPYIKGPDGAPFKPKATTVNVLR